MRGKREAANGNPLRVRRFHISFELLLPSVDVFLGLWLVQAGVATTVSEMKET